MRIPFLRPRPPRLSHLVADLQALEASGVYSNYGPLNAKFEQTLTDRLFGGIGGCLTVNNATTGLIIAIHEAAPRGPGRRLALMPSFTFAATAHAALWAGLTPLLCDIDPETWSMSPNAEDALLGARAGEIACIVPYACFGNGLDLQRYARIAQQTGIGVVIDAAASLGSQDEDGRAFGAGFPHAVVFSMHATKTFATGEAGVIHCGDAERLARLRTMGNFGFGRSREATMPGLNSKLSELGALLGLAKLHDFEEIVRHRDAIAAVYRRNLPGFQFQRVVGRRIAYQFVPALLPEDCRMSRPAIIEALAAEGIGAAHYFSPHLAEHDYFAGVSRKGDLCETAQIAARIISLPISDEMTEAEALSVCAVLRRCIGANR